MSESINHTGFVEKIDGDTVFVRITQQSACSGCHAQSMCSASEKKDKIIEVPDRSGRFHVNEEVIICGQNSMGLQAVLLAFVIPLVIVVGAIVIGTNRTMGRDHERVNRFIAFTALLLYTILNA